MAAFIDTGFLDFHGNPWCRYIYIMHSASLNVGVFLYVHVHTCILCNYACDFLMFLAIKYPLKEIDYFNQWRCEVFLIFLPFNWSLDLTLYNVLRFEKSILKVFCNLAQFTSQSLDDSVKPYWGYMRPMNVHVLYMLLGVSVSLIRCSTDTNTVAYTYMCMFIYYWIEDNTDCWFYWKTSHSCEYNAP